MTDLPSGGKNGQLSDEDWETWHAILERDYAFKPQQEDIKLNEDDLVYVNSKAIWQTVCQMHLEKLVEGMNEKGPLCVNFKIVQKDDLGIIQEKALTSISIEKGSRSAKNDETRDDTAKNDETGQKKPSGI